MRKIVNMRLDLPKPTPMGYADLIRQVGEMTSNRQIYLQQASVGLLLVLCVAASLAVAAGWAQFPFRNGEQAQGVTVAGAFAVEQATTGTGRAPSVSDSASRPKAEETKTAVETKTRTIVKTERNGVGVLWSRRLTIGVPLLIAFVFLVRWLSRPKELEKAVDSKPFSEALEKMAPAIQERCGTPREVRRFQNYLRFLAAWDNSATRPKLEGLEAYLVELAATGIRSKDGNVRADIAGDVIEFFTQQCEMLGLDPNTFQPAGQRSTRGQAIGASG
jgi:hypothetical protein